MVPFKKDVTGGWRREYLNLVIKSGNGGVGCLRKVMSPHEKKQKTNRKFLNYSNRLHAKKRPCSANLWGKFLSEIFTSYRKGGLVKKWWFLGLVKKWWFWAYVLFESWPDKILQFRLWSTWDDLAYCRQNWPKQTSRFKRAASPTQ